MLGNEQEDVGPLLVRCVGVQNQPAAGKAEAFPGPEAQPDRRPVGELTQKLSCQLPDRHRDRPTGVADRKWAIECGRLQSLVTA